MNRTFKLTFIVFCLCGFVAVSQAQGPCTLQSFTGTYAFYESGSSAIFDPNSQPYPFHWAGAFAPFVTVGEVTVAPDGTGHGFYWIRVGSLNGGLDPIPVELTVTEMNEDCTGKFNYQVNLPGSQTPATITERFIVFDNGRQYRSIPTNIANGITTLAWTGEGHRISKPAELLNTCGPQTAHGTYVMPVENLVWFTNTYPIFADAVLLRFNVSMTGDLTGVMYEKLGPAGNIMLPASGTLAVNADCSYAASLSLTIQGVPVTVPIRGVFFEDGKKMYGLNMNQAQTGTLYSLGQGERTGP